MKNKGKARDRALLRTLANKDAQNFATKRLLKDLKEIEEEKIPTVGVTARPLESDLFIWHANIRGPQGTPYEGGVFHLQIEIPESYPHQPPSITLFQELPHPNVFGNKVCLDMLQPQRGTDGEGWSSGYTIQSILLQLQSFLFQTDLNLENKETYQKVKKAIQDANNYKCLTRDCKHGGRLSCWPTFSQAETNLDNFVIKYDEKAEFEKELVCYHTKLSYKDTCLGLGLNVSKIPRTGALKFASACLDYISIKAFIKEGIRWSVNNEKFQYWLPLFFGADEKEKERALHLGKRSLSMIMTNNTRRFKPEFVLEVFPKIIVTIIFLIMDQKRHASIRYIRLLAHIHCQFLFFVENLPQLYTEVENKLTQFLKDESKRTKDSTPNLGAIQAYLLVAPNTKFRDILEVYMQEQLDRQVFWILKSVPELVQEKNLDNIDLDQNRADLTFKNESTSYQILCFYKMYQQLVREKFGSPKALLDQFQKNLGKLPNKLEEDIQKQAFDILKNVNSYDSFFQYLDQKKKSIQEINEMLKQAIKNSKAKRYHGNIEEIHTLPTNEEQFKSLLKKVVTPHDIYNFKTITLDNKEMKEGQKGQKKQYKIQITPKQNFQEGDFMQAVVKRWDWIREQIELNPKITPTQLAQISIQNQKYGVYKKTNRIFQLIQQNYRYNRVAHQIPQIQIENHTWEQLFLKLDLEETLNYIDINPDFRTFYEKLELAKGKLHTLTIPIVQVKNLKSGYHYITALLTSMTKLTHLVISGQPETINTLPIKAIKSFNKGFNKFIKQKGSLHQIEFYNFNAQGNQIEITDKIFGPLQYMHELIAIRFSKTNLLHLTNSSKSLGNLVANLKNLQELHLTDGTIANQVAAKELADGLMRAKQLLIVDISNNPSSGIQGISSLIYNLAFSPKLTYLNVSKSTASNKKEELQQLVEALYKLLRISASLEILDFSFNGQVNTNLNKDFFHALGEIKTLRVLNMNNSGYLDATISQLMGKAIAFNAKQNGSLEFVNLEGCLNQIAVLNSLFNNMNISNHDFETWYGDPTKAAKMQGADFDKVYYNNLKALQFDNCQNLQSNFSIGNFRKYNQNDTELIQLYARSKNLESVLLTGCNLNKNDADLFSIAFDPRRIKFCSQIKVLNLSKNNLGKEGAKIFAKIFEYNNILEQVDISKNRIGTSGGQAIALSLRKNNSVRFLNLFNNNISFDGANAFGETFKHNSKLEFVELGYNRIRNKGLIKLGDGIVANPNSSIKTLGLRFNFLNEDGVIDFLKTLYEDQVKHKPKHLEEIFIKNNQINEFGLFNLKKSYDNLKLKLNIDIFDKLKYLDSEKMERTIWMHPLTSNRTEITRFYEDIHKCGIVTDVRIRNGPKWPNKTAESNTFAVVEFADPNSVERCLKVASRQKSIINLKKFRIYKAGTGTFIYSKKTAKQKKAETTKTNFLKQIQETEVRGGQPGRGRGRGRGRATGRR